MHGLPKTLPTISLWCVIAAPVDYIHVTLHNRARELQATHFPLDVLFLNIHTQLVLYTPLADAGGFHGFHGTPLLRESLPARTEIIVRMRASYSRAHSRVCVLHADVQTTAPLTASAVCS